MLNIEAATNFHNDRVSDHGARTVLGMNGSINSYINTGNPYQNYSLPNDKFEKNCCPKSGVHKVLDTLAYGTALGVGLFACIKNRAKISEFFNKHFSNLSQKIKKIDFAKIKDSLKFKPKDDAEASQNLFQKLYNNIKGINIKNIFKNNNA